MGERRNALARYCRPYRGYISAMQERWQNVALAVGLLGFLPASALAYGATGLFTVGMGVLVATLIGPSLLVVGAERLLRWLTRGADHD